MDQDRLTYLLDKYIRRVCTTQELEEFMHMVNDHGSQNFLEQLLDEFWEHSEEVMLKPHKAQKVFNQVVDIAIQEPMSITIWRRTWISGAAALLLLIPAILWFSKPAAKTKQDIVAGRSVPNEIFKVAVLMLTVTTVNEHQKVTLPDGSTVILNDHSTISYPEKFSKERKITLKGEGYFDIKHLNNHPFIVQTGDVKTTVLGTAFNIKAYENQVVQVTVTRGKVQVANQQAILGVLTPNQQFAFNPGKYQSKLSEVNAKTIVQWQENDLFFDDVTMEQAAKVLAEKFSTNINFATNNVKKCRFSATFLKGESLDEILKVICAFNNAQYQTSATGTIIKGDGC